MAPPFYRLGQVVETRNPTKGRLCLKKGWKPIELPPGKYLIYEIQRNEEYWHIQEMSDGYTYRLKPLAKNSPLNNKPLSIWQNDLLDGIPEQGPSW
jgi:hypothetical protein